MPKSAITGTFCQLRINNRYKNRPGFKENDQTAFYFQNNFGKTHFSTLIPCLEDQTI